LPNERQTRKGNQYFAVLGSRMAIDAKDGKGKAIVRTLSTAHPGVTDPRYRSPAPAIDAPRLYGLGMIPLDNSAAPAKLAANRIR
jgi:hypothetical protein